MRRLTPLALAIALTATACGSAGEPTLSEPATPPTTSTTQPEPTIPAVTESAAREVAPDPAPIEEPQPELDREQVVTATVVIASGGDLEAAITAGLIGEAEAEAALTALETGSIDDLLSE